MNAKPRTKATNLTGVLDEIAEKCENDSTPASLTLGEVTDAVGRRSYGPLLLVIGLFAISPITVIPGLTWVAATLTFVVAGQMALGMKHIWLPKQALATPLPRDGVVNGIEACRGWAGRIDAVLKPRLTFLSQPPFVNVIALLCIAAALVTFPLSFIPLGPLAPSLAVAFFGLGMVARDGLWLSLGIAVLGGAFWLFRALIF